MRRLEADHSDDLYRARNSGGEHTALSLSLSIAQPPAAGVASSLTLRRARCGSPLEFGAILRLYFANSLMGAEKRVLRHIGAVFAGFRVAPQGFGQGANVVRARPAANAQIVDAHRMSPAPKRGASRPRTPDPLNPPINTTRSATPRIASR